MESTWKDIVVWIIGAAFAVPVLRRLVCILRGKRSGGCASCSSKECPLHGLRSRKKSK